MAVYKVPQDVEADDKLIGPFSFRQFIYLIVVAISGAGAWGLSTIFLPLAIVPLPIIVFFAALALPLRKDQPMEAYLSAVVSFYFLKSRKRLWQPDGIDSFVTIIPPKDSERILVKDLNQTEATRRLSYLADLIDTRGWAIRGTTADTSISTDLYYESQQMPDMMDNTTPAAQAMAKQLDAEAAGAKQDAVSRMQTAAAQTPQVAIQTPQAAAATVTTANTPEPTTQSLPPKDMQAKRMTDAAQQATQKKALDALAYANALAEQATEERGSVSAQNQTALVTQNTSASTPDTGTMVLTHQQADELSKQTDVSVQTLAHEANRVAQKNQALQNGDEVTISLR